MRVVISYKIRGGRKKSSKRIVCSSKMNRGLETNIKQLNNKQILNFFFFLFVQQQQQEEFISC
jgi:hypothetical protein